MTPTEQARAVVEALEKVEWRGPLVGDIGGDSSPSCIGCGFPRSTGHRANCFFAAALSAARSLLQGLEREQGPTREALHAMAKWLDDPRRAFTIPIGFDDTRVIHCTPGYLLRRIADALPAPPESPEEEPDGRR